MNVVTRRRALAVVLAIVLAVITAGPAAPAGAARLRAAHEALVSAIRADLHQHPAIPGEAVSVRAPGLDVEAARGFADVSARTPLRVATPFRIASVTKTFVAVAVLRLVEQGTLRLDAPIAPSLSPASVATLARGGYDPEKITVHELLDHTAGLFDYASSRAYDERTTSDPRHRWTRAEQLAFAVDHGRPVGEPGTVYHYSDTGYVLLGEILERATGQTLATAVRDLVGFERLGLDHTYWELSEAPPGALPPCAHQYYDTSFDNIGLDASHDLYGGGGLVSTVGDVSRFFRGLFEGHVFDHDATLDAMLTVSRPGRRDGAALGIFRWSVGGARCWGHPGYWGTVAAYCPARSVAYALTTNQADEDSIDTGPLERTIVDLPAHR